MAWAIPDRLAWCRPFQANPSARTVTWCAVPFHSRTRTVPGRMTELSAPAPPRATSPGRARTTDRSRGLATSTGHRIALPARHMRCRAPAARAQPWPEAVCQMPHASAHAAGHAADNQGHGSRSLQTHVSAQFTTPGTMHAPFATKGQSALGAGSRPSSFRLLAPAASEKHWFESLPLRQGMRQASDITIDYGCSIFVP